MASHKLTDQEQLEVTQTKLRKAEQQLRVLDRKVNQLEARYYRARRENRQAVYRSLRLQLTTLEGVWYAFSEYIFLKIEEEHDLMMKISRESDQRQNR